MRDHTEDNVLDEVIEERRTHNFAFPGMVGEALEVRLAGCLTALEAILLGDDDYPNHVTYIARRLCALTGFYEFDDISCLHGARQGPVHRAERNLAGEVVVLAEEVDKLRFTVRQALMAILTPPAG